MPFDKKSRNYGDVQALFQKAGVDNRYCIPVAPPGADLAPTGTLNSEVLGKAPGYFRNGSWTGLGGSVLRDGVSDSQHDTFKSFPTANLGILGGAFPAIDCDTTTDKARLLVQRVIDDTLRDNAGRAPIYAERFRGDGPKRLYAFASAVRLDSDRAVRTRHLSFTLPDSGEGETTHTIDVIGVGGQYLAHGTHPSGDEYHWHDDYSILDPDTVNDLERIENVDIEDFLDALRIAIEKRGGEIIRRSGGATGETVDTTKTDPTMSIDTVLDGLDALPNTPQNFLHRDDIVAAVAGVRAALGHEACRPDVENRVREWATEDEDWCSPEYFDKIWNSVEHTRVSNDYLDRLFRRNGIIRHAGSQFNSTPDMSAAHRAKSKQRDDRQNTLDDAADAFMFQMENSREGREDAQVRSKWMADVAVSGTRWWKCESLVSDPALLDRIQSFDRYPRNKIGFATFMRDLRSERPDCFFDKEALNPNFDYGEIYTIVSGDYTQPLLNIRRKSPALKMAAHPPKDAAQAQEDVSLLVDFIHKLFGEAAEYELDTLAYMAQTGERPGALLFIVGDGAVGKSLYMNLQRNMFDGGVGLSGDNGIIDGTKMLNEGSRRFALKAMEGQRCLLVRELPKDRGNQSSHMAQITSQLKQVVDPSADADFVPIERKGKDDRMIQNFCRILISSNYENSIEIEANDRRIFYVMANITSHNRPDQGYYSELGRIIDDPERIAPFVRYLLSRNIDDFDRYTNPPMTAAKAERIIAGIENPAERHVEAAIVALETAGRTITNSNEIITLMSQMAEYEYANTGGRIDARSSYSTEGGKKASVTAMSALRRVSDARMIRVPRNDLRTNKERFGRAYILTRNVQADLVREFANSSKREAIDLMRSELRYGLSNMGQHPFKRFRSPEVDTEEADELHEVIPQWGSGEDD